MQGEGQRDHGAGTHRGGGAADHAGAVAPAALNERDIGCQFAQRGHDLDPGGVLADGRTRRTGASDQVRLRDARHLRP
jgi:hypothetical protein